MREARRSYLIQAESNKTVAYTAAGIMGTIALAESITRGGMFPKSNVSPRIQVGSDPGLLHGYVVGSGGLPAKGVIILAVH